MQDSIIYKKKIIGIRLPLVRVCVFIFYYIILFRMIICKILIGKLDCFFYKKKKKTEDEFVVERLIDPLSLLIINLKMI